MRRTTNHIFVRGNAAGQGRTKAEAKADLEKKVDWALAQDTFLEFRFGCVLTATPNPNGWGSAVVFPERQTHGNTVTATCFYGPEERATVIASLRRHACDSTWTPDKDDAAHAAASGLDEPAQRDLIHGFKWQRAYRDAKDRGLSDGDAHAFACRTA